MAAVVSIPSRSSAAPAAPGTGSRFTPEPLHPSAAGPQEFVRPNRRQAQPAISIVIPAYNERDCVAALFDRLHRTLARIGLPWELLFVDDGSTDGTREAIAELAAQDARVRGIAFTRNFGHEAASTAGLEHAAGDVVVLMDADLQDPPELIEAMLEQWRDGYDVVYAQRRRRAGESWFKRASAWGFYRMLSRLAAVNIPADVGDFRLLDRSVVEHFKSLREDQRFVRGLLAWVGHRQSAVLFDRPARHAGEAKYPVRKLVGLAADAVMSFSHQPLRAVLVAGVAMSLAAACGTLVAVALGGKLGGGHGLTLLVMGLGGLQTIALGVVGEYVGRTLRQVQRRPLYLVDAMCGQGLHHR